VNAAGSGGVRRRPWARSPRTAAPTYRTGSVTSADGTSIAYREFGHGPGVVLIHGGMQAAQNFTRLAGALEDEFTVYVPDRRGRGRSGTYGADYGLATESADIEALLRRTGARCVFGLSSGAVIALHAALTIPGIEKLAVYEPPLATATTTPTSFVARYERELDRGKLAAAMVTALKGTADVSILTRIPRFIMEALVGVAVRLEARAHRGADDVAFGALIPTLRYDARLAREAKLESFAAIRADVLLLGGDRSAAYLPVALDALAGALPRAKRVEFKGIGHLAADNEGRPAEVAATLRTFFR
jgi:pimeloyl-ACP methyl ester carboxylesterase